MEGSVGPEGQSHCVSNDVPCGDLLRIPRRHQLVDLALEEGGDVIAMLLDQLACDKKGPGFVVVAHIAKIASTGLVR